MPATRSFLPAPRAPAPYGEVNSAGPDTAPLLCEAFKKLVAGKQ